MFRPSFTYFLPIAGEPQRLFAPYSIDGEANGNGGNEGLDEAVSRGQKRRH
jgi:hypothetical protein